MKKYLIIFLVTIFGTCFSQSAKDLHGVWKGYDDSKTEGIFTFFPDGFVSVKLGTIIIDGRNYIIPDGPNQGKTGYLHYSADFSKTPVMLKLKASYTNAKNEPEESDFVKILIEFRKENEILLFIDLDNENPSDIDPMSPNLIVLYKENVELNAGKTN